MVNNSVSGLEEKVKDYISNRGLSLSEQKLWDAVATLKLNDDFSVEQAVKKALYDKSVFHAGQEEREGKIPPVIEEKDEEDYEEVNVSEYVNVLDDSNRKIFLSKLFEKRKSLMHDFCQDLQPDELENLIQEWEHGRLSKIDPKAQVSQEFVEYVKDYVVNRRLQFLEEKMGEENAQKVKEMINRPRILPIETLNERYNYFNKELQISDSKLSSHAQLFRNSPKTIDEKLNTLLELGVFKDRISKQPGLLTRNSETLKDNYDFLKENIGIPEEKINKNPKLLGWNQTTLEINHEILSTELSLNNETIKSRPKILARNPNSLRETHDYLINELQISEEKLNTHNRLITYNKETLETKYQRLKKLNIPDKKINTTPSLLTISKTKLERTYNFLSESLQLSNGKIGENAELLGVPKKTIQDKYDNAVQTLGKKGKKLLKEQPQLLETKKETLNSNHQYLNQLGINLDNTSIFRLGTLYRTKTSTKRKKLAYITQKIFNQEYQESKEFIQDNPKYLVTSLKTIKELHKKSPDYNWNNQDALKVYQEKYENTSRTQLFKKDPNLYQRLQKTKRLEKIPEKTRKSPQAWITKIIQQTKEKPQTTNDLNNTLTLGKSRIRKYANKATRKGLLKKEKSNRKGKPYQYKPTQAIKKR